MRPLTVKLPSHLEAELRARARRSGLPLGAVVREAVERYMSEDNTPGPSSVAEAAADLAGSLEGPADLSTNEKHLREYGR